MNSTSSLPRQVPDDPIQLTPSRLRHFLLRRRNRLPLFTAVRLALKNNQFVTFNLVTFPTPSTAFSNFFPAAAHPLHLCVRPAFTFFKRGRETTHFLSPRKLFLNLFSTRSPPVSLTLPSTSIEGRLKYPLPSPPQAEFGKKR